MRSLYQVKYFVCFLASLFMSLSIVYFSSSYYSPQADIIIANMEENSQTSAHKNGDVRDVSVMGDEYSSVNFNISELKSRYVCNIKSSDLILKIRLKNGDVVSRLDSISINKESMQQRQIGCSFDVDHTRRGDVYKSRYRVLPGSGSLVFKEGASEKRVDFNIIYSYESKRNNFDPALWNEYPYSWVEKQDDGLLLRSPLGRYRSELRFIRSFSDKARIVLKFKAMGGRVGFGVGIGDFVSLVLGDGDGSCLRMDRAVLGRASGRLDTDTVFYKLRSKLKAGGVYELKVDVENSQCRLQLREAGGRVLLNSDLQAGGILGAQSCKAISIHKVHGGDPVVVSGIDISTDGELELIGI